MSALIELETILAGAVPRSTPTFGIYFLLDGQEVVYVGQSRNLQARLYDHVRKGSLQFDAYFTLPCIRRDLNALEGLYIAKFRPRYNRTMRWDRLELPLDSLRGTAKKAAIREREAYFGKAVYRRPAGEVLENVKETK